MAHIVELGRNRFQVAIDYKGVRKKRTFRGPQKMAQQWADEVEAAIELTGKLPPDPLGMITIEELVIRYEREMAAAGQHWGSSKHNNLQKLKKEIGHKVVKTFTKQDAITWGKFMSKTRGPGGVRERMNYLSSALKWAKAHHDFPLMGQIDAVADAIKVLGDLGKAGQGGNRQYRQLSEAEIDKVKAACLSMSKSKIDMAAIIDVLRVLPLRISELCSIEWDHLDPVTKTVKMCRKPRKKSQPIEHIVPLPTIAGVDTYQMIAGRPRQLKRPFPYLQATVSSTFWIAHRMAGVIDIHLHDLRAHAITWLATNGFEKANTKALTGHSRDSKVMDEIYTRVSAAQVHAALKEAGLDVKTKDNVVRFENAA